MVLIYSNIFGHPMQQLRPHYSVRGQYFIFCHRRIKDVEHSFRGPQPQGNETIEKWVLIHVFFPKLSFLVGAV